MGKRILVVDTSSLVRRFLVKLLQKQGYSVDSVGDGSKALEKIRSQHYSLVTLDFKLPSIDGLELLKIIMNEKPIRVLMIGSYENSATLSFEALDLGAIEYIQRPQKSIDIATISDEIIQKVKKCLLVLPQNIHKRVYTHKEQFINYESDIKMGFVLIGASTGGPRLIETICRSLPKNYPHAVCVVQHMPTEFTANFASRLNKLSMVEVLEAENGLELKQGRVIIAKGGKHLHIRKKLKSYSVLLAPNTRERFFVPSVDEMFLSAMETLPIKNILAVELTGIGDDGADAMVELKKRGAYTLAESEESAVVYGMPKEVARRGGATKVLDFDKILDEILHYGQ